MKTLLLIINCIPFIVNSQAYVDSVYDFDIGDEFHYLANERGQYDIKKTYSIEKIINKTITGNQVQYQFTHMVLFKLLLFNLLQFQIDHLVVC